MSCAHDAPIVITTGEGSTTPWGNVACGQCGKLVAGCQGLTLVIRGGQLPTALVTYRRPRVEARIDNVCTRVLPAHGEVPSCDRETRARLAMDRIAAAGPAFGELLNAAILAVESARNADGAPQGHVPWLRLNQAINDVLAVIE